MEQQRRKPELTSRFTKPVLFGVCAFAMGGVPAAIGFSQTKEASTEAPAPAAADSQMNAAQLAATVVHHGDGVAATVNDSVISDYDLKQRIALFVATSGVKPAADALNAIRDQVLKQLETEQM